MQDSRLLLSWGPPTNKGCVDVYVINILLGSQVVKVSKGRGLGWLSRSAGSPAGEGMGAEVGRAARLCLGPPTPYPHLITMPLSVLPSP